MAILMMFLKASEAAKSAGLLPVKINCVIKASKDEDDAQAVTTVLPR
ncbi:MAG: hypothetical protein MZV63_45925 [Marinilabiliales bacterium]|nr:hypothetical protein [Marinilabiliales bacterium]